MESIKTWIQILNDNYPISIVGNKTLFLEEDLEEVKKTVKNNFPEIEYYQFVDFHGHNFVLMFESIYKKIIGDENDFSKKFLLF